MPLVLDCPLPLLTLFTEEIDVALDCTWFAYEGWGINLEDATGLCCGSCSRCGCYDLWFIKLARGMEKLMTNKSQKMDKNSHKQA